MRTELWHQSNPIIAGCAGGGGSADIEIVGHAADGVGNGEDGGEVVGVASVGVTGGTFERVGLAGAGHPSHANVVALRLDVGDAERGRAVGRVGPRNLHPIPTLPAT